MTQIERCADQSVSISKAMRLRADACERCYYGAGGFGPEPEIDWPEDELSAEFEEAEAASQEWYGERARMFWDLVVYKAKDVVTNYLRIQVAVVVRISSVDGLCRIRVRCPG